MVDLTIHHQTTYRYHRPVMLGPHRLMLRPRESRELQILRATLAIVPDAQVDWAHDVAGNAVATATFDGPTDRLIVDSRTEIRLSAKAWPVFAIAGSALSFPFRYGDDEWSDLGALAVRQYPDPDGHLSNWTQGFVAGNPTDTLSLLKDLSAGVSAATAYEVRETEGTQAPLETLNRKIGSCRDFAVLFAEAARSLGFGARIVSGYLHDPDRQSLGSQGTGSTHAWNDVYVPGAGWIAFDPTNRSLGGANLVPVATVRHIAQSIPITGSFAGDRDAFAGLDVEVTTISTGADP